MAAILKAIDDPRSPLMKYTRTELCHLARFEGREFDPGMPAPLMRQLFESKPPRQWPIPMKGPLGKQHRLLIPDYEAWKQIAFQQPRALQDGPKEIPQVNAMADLQRQWEAQKPAPAPKRGNEIIALRQECKRKGVKIQRTDNVAKLKERLAAHGQDAS